MNDPRPLEWTLQGKDLVAPTPFGVVYSIALDVASLVPGREAFQWALEGPDREVDSIIAGSADFGRLLPCMEDAQRDYGDRVRKALDEPAEDEVPPYSEAFRIGVDMGSPDGPARYDGPIPGIDPCPPGFDKSAWDQGVVMEFADQPPTFTDREVVTEAGPAKEPDASLYADPATLDPALLKVLGMEGLDPMRIIPLNLAPQE